MKSNRQQMRAAHLRIGTEHSSMLHSQYYTHGYQRKATPREMLQKVGSDMWRLGKMTVGRGGPADEVR